MNDPEQPLNEEEKNNDELKKIEKLKEILQDICESLCLDTLDSKPKDIPLHMISFLQKKVLQFFPHNLLASFFYIYIL